LFLFIYYYCDEWGNTVAFTKVITIYQIYNTGINPPHSLIKETVLFGKLLIHRTRVRNTSDENGTYCCAGK
jgi:hypothetical protein